MNTLKKHLIKGTIFVLIAGVLSHFVYEWSGKMRLIGLFFPINESVWEHMKLCFFPMLVASFYLNRKLVSDYPCITSSLLLGVLMCAYLIPVLFYTYTGILGYHIAFLDISTFFVSVILSFIAIYKLTTSCRVASNTQFFKLLIFITAICFFLFTYRPPDLGIFVAPGR
ncbi:MAG: hypothetical protein IKV27_03730 [Lachnospiraceae bacterium]|nr:hypothetical protein [Lachnospiraceae bacterium]